MVFPLLRPMRWNFSIETFHVLIHVSTKYFFLNERDIRYQSILYQLLWILGWLSKPIEEILVSNIFNFKSQAKQAQITLSEDDLIADNSRYIYLKGRSPAAIISLILTGSFSFIKFSTSFCLSFK